MGDWPRWVPAASPREAALRSNAHCEQSNHADPDHQHGECYGIIVEPICLECMIRLPSPVSLVGPAGKLVQMCYGTDERDFTPARLPRHHYGAPEWPGTPP
jgi:hypothetical protein